MFNLPEKYILNKNIDLKDFIPKYIKPNDKKRIRDIIKTVKLTDQIAGEEIASVLNENYRCQVIQFYDIEIGNIKDANFIAATYQNIIKPFCVIHMCDGRNEVYSLAVKRLSHTDRMQVIVENSLVTDKYMMNVPDSSRDKFLEYMDFMQIKNRLDKVKLYKEWYYKAYMVVHAKAYVNTNIILEGNCWYDSDRTLRISQKYMELVQERNSLKKAVTNADKMKINKRIKVVLQELEVEGSI